MAHRKEEGGWHVCIRGSVGAGEPKAGDKGDQDEMGLGEASHHLEGFPTGAPSVIPDAGKEARQHGVRDQCLASLDGVEKRGLG